MVSQEEEEVAVVGVEVPKWKIREASTVTRLSVACVKVRYARRHLILVG